jgi:hypothetical protein
MLNRARTGSKRRSKTEAVQSVLPRPLPRANIHIGPSDYVPWQRDNKVCFLRMEGRGFGNAPIEVELRLSVEDSPNSPAASSTRSAAAAWRAIARSAGADERRGLPDEAPPRQLTDDLAKEQVERFLRGRSSDSRRLGLGLHPPAGRERRARRPVVIGIASSSRCAEWRVPSCPRTSGERARAHRPRVRTWYRGSCAARGCARRLARSIADRSRAAARGERPRRRRVLEGAIFLAGWLTILAGTLDILDGGVARRGGIASPRGALVDSLVDRYAEFATFVGLGAFFRDSWVLLAVASPRSARSW